MSGSGPCKSGWNDEGVYIFYPSNNSLSEAGLMILSEADLMIQC